LVYFDVMEAWEVEIRSGGCSNGEPGDSSWTPGDGDIGPENPFTVVVDGKNFAVTRNGCYVNDEDTAGYVALCGDGLMVQVVANDDDLAALTAWVDFLPEGFPRDTPSAAGICYSEA
jgi:hypothetical protein